MQEPAATGKAQVRFCIAGGGPASMALGLGFRPEHMRTPGVRKETRTVYI